MNKRLIKEYIVVTIAIFIIALSFNVFFLPFDMVIGGSSGIAVVFNYLFNINPSLTVLILHVLALILGYIFLGLKQVSKSIYGSIAYPAFIQLTNLLKEHMISLNIDKGNLLIFIIFGAIIVGMASGYLYKMGYTAGGDNIINQINNKYFGLTIGTSNFIINVIIVIFGGIAIGFDKVIYAVLILYIRGISTDKILIGNYSNKLFYIITSESSQVKRFIYDELGYKVTEFESIGGYSNTGSKILMCVVPTLDYFKLKEGILHIDDTAFFLATHAHE